MPANPPLSDGETGRLLDIANDMVGCCNLGGSGTRHEWCDIELLRRAVAEIKALRETIAELRARGWSIENASTVGRGPGGQNSQQP